jgi:ATP-dependent DNA helicase RecQ
LKQAEIVFKPRKQVAPSKADTIRAFPVYQFPRLLGELAAEEGRILSRWNDAGWGKLVAAGKHAGHFSDELVQAMTDMIRLRWQPNPFPTWICAVPSLQHPHLVPDFAFRLAQQLQLPFFSLVEKAKYNQPQKGQQNSFHQCRNLDGAFAVHQPLPDGPVLLIDDIVDSGWTLTVVAALLRQHGCGPVYPAALASTSVHD